MFGEEVGGELELFGNGEDGLFVAGAVVAKGGVLAEYEMVEGGEGAEKFGWGEGGKLRGEGEGDDVACAGCAEEVEFLFEGVDEGECAFGVEERGWMEGEGGDDESVCEGAHGGEEVLVAEVDAVEKADGERSHKRWGV